MHTMNILTLLATLLAFSMAAPTPTKTSIAKRSFKVPRQLNPKMLGKRRSGQAAMEKASRKYGWGTSNNAAVPANGTGKENGVVGALPEENDALFLSPVMVGEQQLNLDFDTGSSDLCVTLAGFSVTADSLLQLGLQYTVIKERSWCPRRFQ